MGRACAERFAKGGGQVLIVSNDGESVDKAVSEIGGKTSGFVGDVRNGTDMEKAAAEAVARHGGIDILACCAGIQRYGTVVDTPENVWDDVMSINLKGIYLASKYAIPEMRKRGGGAIVAISSVQSYASQAGVAAYTASKGAINQLTRAMSLGLVDHGIRVNAVAPGTISTELARNSVLTSDAARQRILGRTPMKRLGEPEEVADVVAFLLSDASSYVTGEIVYIDGGRLALNYTVPV